VRGILYEDEAQESEEEILGAGEEMDDNPQSCEIQHQSSLLKETNPLHLPLHILKHPTLILQEKHEEAAIHYVNLKDSIDDYYNKNIAHRDQTDKLVKAFMSSFKKRSTAINDLYKGLEVITQLLKDITNYKDTSSIKSMMIVMYNAFRGQSSSVPSSNVTLTFSLTDTLVNVEGENATHTATEEPPSHTEGETDAKIQEKPKEPKQSTNTNIEFICSSTHPPSITQAKPITIIHHEPSIPQREGKGIATDKQAKDQRKLIKASSIVRLDPDELDKEEEIKQAKEKSRLNAISKTEVIKAKKLGIHLKEVITTKAGELFKKAQDAKHEVLKKQHTNKVRKSLELRKHKWSDINKVGMEALVSYLVAASMVKSPENTRFKMKLRKLIVEHPDKEKLKSKKGKLEALGYKMD
nr:hypothetical protein [Tanacetum cinerariifolium]